MSLTSEDIERLQAILETNKKSHASGYNHQTLVETTDESIALVRRGESKHTSRVYHAYADGHPACQTRTDGRYDEWDIEVADGWMCPCKWCFREGEGDEDTDGDSE